jgi:hypothetical protein
VTPPEGQPTPDELYEITHHHKSPLAGFFAFVGTLAVAGSLAVGIVSLTSNAEALSQIQQSRVAACQDQNSRNRATVADLDNEIAKIIAKTPADQQAQVTAQLNASKAFTVGLIDSLAPVKDCATING